MEEEVDYKGAQGNFLRFRNVLYFDCGGGYMITCVCQNSKKHTLKKE